MTLGVGSIIENDYLSNPSKSLYDIDLTRLGCVNSKVDNQFYLNKTNIMNNLLKNNKALVLSAKAPFEAKNCSIIKKQAARKPDPSYSKFGTHSSVLRKNLKLCLGKSLSNSDRGNIGFS